MEVGNRIIASSERCFNDVPLFFDCLAILLMQIEVSFLAIDTAIFDALAPGTTKRRAGLTAVTTRHDALFFVDEILDAFWRLDGRIWNKSITENVPIPEWTHAVHRDASRAIGGLVRDKEHYCVQAFHFSGHSSTANEIGGGKSKETVRQS